MSTTGQVWHIARKDVAQLRWWFVGYAVLIVGATLTSVELLSNERSSLASLVAPALWLVGGVIAAQLVQVDAPSSSRAFWVSVPIDVKSLLLSKLATVLVVLMLPAAIGQLVALNHYGITAARVLSLMTTSVWVYGTWLLLAMTLAALTRRFASLVGVFVAVPVAVMLLGVIIGGGPWSFAPMNLSANAWGLIATFGATALLVRTFRDRSATRGGLIAGVVICAAGLLAISRPTTLAARPLIAGDATPHAQIDVDAADLNSLENSAEQLVQFTARGMVAPYRYSLMIDSASATWADGRSESLRMQYIVGEQPFSFGTADSGSAGSVWLTTSKERRARAPSQLKRARIDGVAETLVSSPLASLNPGERSYVRDGEMSLEIRGPQIARNGATLKVATVFADRTDVREIMSVRSNYTLRLVWPDRADIVDLHLNSVGTEQRILVLPGASAHVVSMWRDVQRARNADTLPAPLAHARLELLRWTPVARYPVTMEHIVR